MTASSSFNLRRRSTTGPGVARLPQVGRGADCATEGRRARQAAVTRVAGRARAECHGRRASFHTPAQISQCFSETCQRHPGAQRAFLIFWQWGKKSAQSCPVPVLSLGWACSFSLELHKWGEPGLAPPLGLLRSSDTLFREDEGIEEGSEKRVSAPPLRRGDLVRAS